MTCAIPRRDEYLSTVHHTLEVEVQTENAPFEGTLETAAIRVLPLAIDNHEVQIFVRGTAVELQDAEVLVGMGKDLVCGRLVLVDEVWIKHLQRRY